MQRSHRRTLVSIRLSIGTAAICEDERDRSLWITSDLDNRDRLPADAISAPLNSYGVTKALQIDEVQPVGGRLPPNVRSVELRTAHQILAEPVIGPGVWIAALQRELHLDDLRSWVLLDRGSPSVLFRDASGEIVPQPLPDGAQAEPVADADTPCPACGGRQWVRARGLADVEDGRPFLACTHCGHRERVDGQVLVATSTPDGSDERAQVEQERHLVHQTRRQLRGVPLPLYGLGPQWRGRRFVHFVHRHRGSGKINLFHGMPLRYEPPYADVENAWGSDAGGSVEARAQEAVFKCLLREPLRGAEERSPDAMTLAFQSDLRDRRERAAAADLREETVSVDGEPMTFVLAEGGDWLAGAGSIDDLGVMVIAGGVPLDQLALARFHDLNPYLGGE